MRIYFSLDKDVASHDKGWLMREYTLSEDDVMELDTMEFSINRAKTSAMRSVVRSLASALTELVRCDR